MGNNPKEAKTMNKQEIQEKIKKEVVAHAQPKGYRSKESLIRFYEEAKELGLLKVVSKCGKCGEDKHNINTFEDGECANCGTPLMRRLSE